MSVLEQLLGAAMQGMNRGGDAGGPLGAAPTGGAGASPIMGILLQLLMSGGQGGASRPGASGGGLGGLLGGLLGGGAAPGRPAAGGDPLSQLAGALLGGGQGTSQAGGGLSGMLQQFQQAGLGRQADSWVGTGQNLPVEPDQLTRVFGRDRLQGLADQHGMDLNQLLGGLSQQLPSAVDALTPKGAVPEPDDFAATIGSLLGGKR